MNSPLWIAAISATAVVAWAAGGASREHREGRVEMAEEVRAMRIELEAVGDPRDDVCERIFEMVLDEEGRGRFWEDYSRGH